MLRAALFALLASLVLPAHAQSLELEDCRISAGPGYPGIKARCGTMLRPENPDDPASPDITLRVAVVSALNLNPATDPVVPLAGGPGQGAVEFYSAYAAAFEPARRNRDILLVDQRGTGESSRMDCPVDDEILSGEYTIEETVRFTSDCLDQLPHDPAWFTTSVAVSDLEAVREALGYPALNLYGVSYGTRVAQHFARRYPESTRTVVLDGVAPPQLALGPEIATESQQAVDNILARCAADTDCNERFPGVQASFDSIVEELRAEPRQLSVPNPSTGRPENLSFGANEFAGAIRLLLYSPRSIALVPLLVHEGANGNLVPLASQYLMTMIALADSLALGMHNSIMCNEDVPFYDKATIDYDALEASYMGALQVEALEAMCSVWPEGPVDDEFKVALATDIPVLLLSGDADPITPPRYADLAMVDLENARHLIGQHQGHGQLAVGCTRRIVASFIESADLNSIETDCLERSFIMPFFLDFSGPAP